MTIVEVFNDKEKLEGVGQLENFTFEDTEREALITGIWKDQKDQFYIIDKRGAPVVRMGRIMGL